jgi:hypothetical protein
MTLFYTIGEVFIDIIAIIAALNGLLTFPIFAGICWLIEKIAGSLFDFESKLTLKNSFIL